MNFWSDCLLSVLHEGMSQWCYLVNTQFNPADFCMRLFVAVAQEEASPLLGDMWVRVVGIAPVWALDTTALVDYYVSIFHGYSAG